MELDGVDGLPQHLIDFATSLKGGLAGSLSGPGTGAPRVGARALKVKRLIALNKILTLSRMRKYDCICSGSRQFDNATKRMAICKPSVEKLQYPSECPVVSQSTAC